MCELRIWAASDQKCLRTYAESDGPDQPAHGEQRPGCYFAHALDGLNQCILRMSEDTFLLCVAHIISGL